MNTELIARLEAAEVGSFDLDYVVWFSVDDEEGPTNCTTSLDAAIALAERVLPHWYVYRISDERNHMSCPGWGAGLGERNGMRIEYARAKTSALALCIAILRALGAQEQK